MQPRLLEYCSCIPTSTLDARTLQMLYILSHSAAHHVSTPLNKVSLHALPALASRFPPATSHSSSRSTSLSSLGSSGLHCTLSCLYTRLLPFLYSSLSTIHVSPLSNSATMSAEILGRKVGSIGYGLSGKRPRQVHLVSLMNTHLSPQD